VASIDPPLGLWTLTACAVILSALLALGALIPAILGHFRSAVLVAAPAFIAGILTTVLLVYFFLISLDGTPDFGGFIVAWALVAGIPMSVSVSAILLAWFRSCKKESLVK
jgi:hypothetical protein